MTDGQHHLALPVAGPPEPVIERLEDGFAADQDRAYDGRIHQAILSSLPDGLALLGEGSRAFAGILGDEHLLIGGQLAAVHQRV